MLLVSPKAMKISKVTLSQGLSSANSCGLLINSAHQRKQTIWSSLAVPQWNPFRGWFAWLLCLYINSTIPFCDEQQETTTHPNDFAICFHWRDHQIVCRTSLSSLLQKVEIHNAQQYVSQKKPVHMLTLLRRVHSLTISFSKDWELSECKWKNTINE